jgi:hypothetical protein
MTIVMTKRAHSIRSGSNSPATSLGSAAGRYLAIAAIFAAALGLAVSIAPLDGRAQTSGATPSGTEAPNTSQFIGKTAGEIRAKLGPPTTTEFLQETGGYLIIYARPGLPHYVFETGPDLKVKRAAVAH